MSSTKQSESTDFDWAVRLHRISLKACGIWPEFYESPWKNFLVNSYSFVGVLALLLFVILPSLCDLYHSRHDMLAVIDNLQITVPMAAAMAKYVDVWAGKQALAAMMQGISNDWSKPKSSREQEVMVSQAELFRSIFKVTAVLVVIPTTLFMGLPILGVNLRYEADLKQKPLIVASRFFFDANVSPTYELIYCAQLCASTFAAMSYTAIDNFIVLLIIHIQGQLINLRSRLLTMSRSKTFHWDLIANVNDHIRLTRVINSVDSVFTLIFATILLYFAITFCLNGLMILYLIQMEDDIAVSRLILIILILTTSFLHCALYCIMGEVLVTELEKSYNAVCASDWETLTPGEARKLILVMMHTNRPIYLTAAKIVPMNMMTFCAMLRMSGSYVSILLARLK